MRRYFFFYLVLASSFSAAAQQFTVSGIVTSPEGPVPFANVYFKENQQGTATDDSGNFRLEDVKPGRYLLRVSAVGFSTFSKSIVVQDEDVEVKISLSPQESRMDEVVVTGTMKEVSRLESPVPVEVFSPAFFKMNPTPTMYDALQNVNGVRPQLNCNVCNTGDIHINGLEGPYTMVLIDGMPIVSGLSSVYGLSGIPNAMIQRIEIVKGPASSLYGSEAVGGLINVITKDPISAPVFSADIMSTSWLEHNIDIGFKFDVGPKISVLNGINYFNYSNPIDNNGDNFTDVTLQDRISVFQKWNFERENSREMSLAGRYLYEDRWGGEMNWTRDHRGGEEVYGESIYTKRWELIGKYALPIDERVTLSLSYNSHHQNSYYGDLAYMADQKIAFTQMTWNKAMGGHDLILGSALRYTYYDDNTTATALGEDDKMRNNPDIIWLPGIFLQDEIALADKQKLLLGIRYDYNSTHGNIFTPRLAYKLSLNDNNILRLNAGTGFRVVNLFTEEHAALTGARDVYIEEELKPEKSYNINLNYIKKMQVGNNLFIDVDATLWHTYFNSQILPDYETDVNKIIYDNLDGHAVTQGASLNFDLEFLNGLKILAGASFMNVYTEEENDSGEKIKQRPLLTEKWTGTWAVSYPIVSLNLTFNYTGNLYGPMRLPVLGNVDPRPDTSPWWSIQNIQLIWKKPEGNWEIYGGIKNLLNYTPPSNSIARANDPFEKKVLYNKDGEVDTTPFDPSYVFAPNQGIRGFLGLRMNIPAF